MSPTVAAKGSKGTGGPAGDEAQNLVPTVEPLPFDTTQITHPANRSSPQPGDPCHPLARGAHAPAVALPAFDWPVDVADPVTANEGATYTHEGSRNFRMHNVVPATMAVRRLTPRECERLQGFPDDWTLITYRGKPASDGPRYKALGNSMATNVMRWIGLRIAAVEGGTHEVR